MRKIFVINLLISLFFLSIVFIFNSNLPIKINDENIDNYQHNFLTDLNKLDFRHWALLYLIIILRQIMQAYIMLFTYHQTRKTLEIFLYKYVEEYQN